MSKTTDHIQSLEEQYAHTFFYDGTDPYQKMMQFISDGRLSYSDMERALCRTNASPKTQAAKREAK